MDEEDLHFLKLSVLTFDIGQTACVKLIESILKKSSLEELQRILNNETSKHKLSPHCSKRPCRHSCTRKGKKNDMCVSKKEWDKLYKEVGKCCTYQTKNCICMFKAREAESLYSIDLSLTTKLLLIIFQVQAHAAENSIRKLLECRHKIAHRHSTKINDEVFQATWAEAEHAVCQIALKHSKDLKEELTVKMSDIFHQRCFATKLSWKIHVDGLIAKQLEILGTGTYRLVLEKANGNKQSEHTLLEVEKRETEEDESTDGMVENILLEFTFDGETREITTSLEKRLTHRIEQEPEAFELEGTRFQHSEIGSVKVQLRAVKTLSSGSFLKEFRENLPRYCETVLSEILKTNSTPQESFKIRVSFRVEGFPNVDLDILQRSKQLESSEGLAAHSQAEEKKVFSEKRKNAEEKQFVFSEKQTAVEILQQVEDYDKIRKETEGKTRNDDSGDHTHKHAKEAEGTSEQKSSLKRLSEESEEGKTEVNPEEVEELGISEELKAQSADSAAHARESKESAESGSSISTQPSKGSGIDIGTEIEYEKESDDDEVFHNASGSPAQDIRRCDEIRILLIGKTGIGKSATANTIIGEKNRFKEEVSGKAVTINCQCESKFLDDVGRAVTVVDTPGLCSSDNTDLDINDVFTEAISLSSPGFHVIVLVLSHDRFKKEDSDTLSIYSEYFGDDLYNHLIILFTHLDVMEQSGKSFEDFLQTYLEKPAFESVYVKCNKRAIAFNNKNKDRRQVVNFFEEIEKVVKQNNERLFQHILYRIVDDEIASRKKFLRKSIRKKKTRDVLKTLKEKSKIKKQREMSDSELKELSDRIKERRKMSKLDRMFSTSTHDLVNETIETIEKSASAEFKMEIVERTGIWKQIQRKIRGFLSSARGVRPVA